MTFLLLRFQKMDMGPCPKVHSLQLRKEYPFQLLLASIVFEMNVHLKAEMKFSYLYTCLLI